MGLPSSSLEWQVMICVCACVCITYSKWFLNTKREFLLQERESLGSGSQRERESLSVWPEKNYENMVTMGWRVALLVICLP